MQAKPKEREDSYLREEGVLREQFEIAGPGEGFGAVFGV
jgi:hypothetical protein